eukprot:1155715-Pelagomonas_calceolata.AAC.5
MKCMPFVKTAGFEPDFSTGVLGNCGFCSGNGVGFKAEIKFDKVNVLVLMRNLSEINVGGSACHALCAICKSATFGQFLKAMRHFWTEIKKVLFRRSSNAPLPSLKLQVRLNFLSTLLDEAYGYMHSFLTASVLNRKLFRQPFHRDVKITVQNAAAMQANMAYCQQQSSCAPHCIVLDFHLPPAYTVNISCKSAMQGCGTNGMKRNESGSMKWGKGRGKIMCADVGRMFPTRREEWSQGVALGSPRVKGLLLVSPEERLSLQLKRDELWDLIHGVCAELDKLSTMPYKDVIDENDVMLPLRKAKQPLNLQFRHPLHPLLMQRMLAGVNHTSTAYPTHDSRCSYISWPLNLSGC